MNRTRLVLLISLTLVALLALAPAASAKTKPGPRPDLVVKKVSKPPKTKTVGTKLKLVVKVANVGEAKAGKSKLGLYLGRGRKHTKKDKRLKRVKVKPLAAGKSKKLKVRLVIPAKAKPGTYRLFACADDTRKVKEAKERNCKGTRKVRLLAKTPPPPSPPPAAAFTMTDGFDWGYDAGADREGLEPGDPVTMTLTAANGVAGQAGYTRAGVGPEGFRSGNSTTLDFSAPTNSEDDGQVSLQLPFAFPFGGVKEQAVSVSTNGWISFGNPGWDYWGETQRTDYRGVPTVVGELERGIMPYWSDLAIDDVGSGAGAVREVVAPDNSWVAFQWETHPVGSGTPRRTLQLVLFPDGAFRFDYPGANANGGTKAFVGYSLGHSDGFDAVATDVDAVPGSSLLFTPSALPATGPTPAGEITATLPKGSSFVSAAAGCTLTTAPGPFSSGLVSCPAPALAPGDQLSRTVTFATPDEAPGQHDIANFRLLGAYSSGGLNLTDADEIDSLTTRLVPTTITINPEYNGPAFQVGVPAIFEVTIESADFGLDEPTAVFEVTNGALGEAYVDGQSLGCEGPGDVLTCSLPSGMGGTKVEVEVIPNGSEPPGLRTTAQALNAPAASISFAAIP